MTLFKINGVLGTHLPKVLLKPQLSPAHKSKWCSSGVQDGVAGWTPASHLHHPRVARRLVQGHFMWQWGTETRGSASQVADCCPVWPTGEEILLNCSYFTRGCSKAACKKLWAFLIKLKEGLQTQSHVERHSLNLFTPLLLDKNSFIC